jgi:hypothetical protein
MPCTALEKAFEPDYELFLELLRQGYVSMTRMSDIIWEEYNRVMPGRIKSAAVMRSRLYQMAKRESFATDKAEALRGLRALHGWQIYNANINKAMTGEFSNIKLHYQHEEGWTEKAELKTDISVNADGIVNGVLDALRKAKPNDSIA